MAESDLLTPLLATIDQLLSWLQKSRVRGLLIGGVAVGLVGRPRLTRDVDAVIFLDDDQLPPFLALGALFGFKPKIKDAVDFARQSRVLLVRHEPTKIDVDLSLGALPFELEALSRAVHVNIRGVDLPVPSPEDLIIMKAVAHRDRDLIDIGGILDKNAKVDVLRIRRWVQDFADALEMPEIFDDVDRLLTKAHPPRRRKKKP